MPVSPPLVSIVIPVRDRPDLVRRALRSVIAQTLPDWEAIVVDDASEPALRDLGDDPRVRLVRLDRNVGPAGARNAGLAEARGRYAAFLDSDDAWLPGKLSQQIKAMEAARGAQVLVAAAEIDDGRGAVRVLPRRAKAPGERIAGFLYVANQFAQASGVMAPTDLARAVGFDAALRQYEDHLFLLRAEAAGAKVVVGGPPLFRHHVDPRPDRLGRRDDLVRAREFLSAAEGLLAPAERFGFELRCLAEELPPNELVRAAAKALATRGAPKGAAVKALLRVLVGPSAYASLRDAGRRARGVMRWST